MSASILSIPQVQILCVQYLRAGDVNILAKFSQSTGIRMQKYPKHSGFYISIVENAVLSLQLLKICIIIHAFTTRSVSLQCRADVMESRKYLHTVLIFTTM